MADDRITELSSNLLHSSGKNNYSLRIIQYVDKNGVTCRKFGISEFWYSDSSKQWYPSRTHHAYLPIALWTKLTGLSHLVEPFMIADNDQGYAGASDATIQLADDDRQQLATPRRRGRPSKLSNERTGVDGIGSADSVVGSQAPRGGVNTKEKKPCINRVGTTERNDNHTTETTTHVAANEVDGIGSAADDERTMPLFPESNV